MNLPGIFKLRDDQYRTLKATSEGAILDAHKGMCYFRDKRIKKLIRWKETPALRDGAAAHCLLLEPDKFPERFHVYIEPTLPAKRKRELDAAGKHAIHQHTYDLFSSMAVYIHGHSLYGQLFDGAYCEHSIVWEMNGGKCKTKPDLVSKAGTIVSVKTMGGTKGVHLSDRKSINDEAARSSWRIGTGWQALGFQAVFGQVPDFLYLVCRLAYPHEDNVRLYRVPQDEVEYSMRLCRRLHSQVRDAMSSGVWTADEDQLIELVTPEWQRRLDETR